MLSRQLLSTSYRRIWESKYLLRNNRQCFPSPSYPVTLCSIANQPKNVQNPSDQIWRGEPPLESAFLPGVQRTFRLCLYGPEILRNDLFEGFSVCIALLGEILSFSTAFETPVRGVIFRKASQHAMFSSHVVLTS